MNDPGIQRMVIKKAKKVVAITPIHEEDAQFWGDQLLAEFERLDFEVIWHLNHITEKTAQRFIQYPRTIGYTRQTREALFIDYHRLPALEMAHRSGATWITTHDADETLEPDAPEILKDLLQLRQLHVTRWYNIWRVNANGSLMIRMDDPFVGYKARFYPVGPWRYTCRGNGMASLYADGEWPHKNESTLRILHWGFSSPELRKRHYNYWMGPVKKQGGPQSEYWNVLVEKQFEDKCVLREFDPKVPHYEFIR